MIAITHGTPYDPMLRHKAASGMPIKKPDRGLYRQADGSGWAVTDKIFGYLDKAGNIYNEIRYPTVPSPGDANYEEYLAWKRTQNTMLFGLPSPIGIILLVGGIGLVGLIVYKVATK
jgi:hypothetical protein